MSEPEFKIGVEVVMPTPSWEEVSYGKVEDFDGDDVTICVEHTYKRIVVARSKISWQLPAGRWVVAPEHRTTLTDGTQVYPGHRETIKDGVRAGQQRDYVVLSEEERAKGFVRPVRRSYLHTKCGTVTTMGTGLAETYARDPKFYSGTFCCGCGTHFPVGEKGEFVWDGTNEKVGT